MSDKSSNAKGSKFKRNGLILEERCKSKCVEHKMIPFGGYDMEEKPYCVQQFVLPPFVHPIYGKDVPLELLDEMSAEYVEWFHRNILLNLYVKELEVPFEIGPGFFRYIREDKFGRHYVYIGYEYDMIPPIDALEDIYPGLIDHSYSLIMEHCPDFPVSMMQEDLYDNSQWLGYIIYALCHYVTKMPFEKPLVLTVDNVIV